MTIKKFLDNGSPLKTVTPINKNNKNIKILNLEKFLTGMIPSGSFGRIHSKNNDKFTVWVLDESTYNNIIIEVPQHMMGIFFVQHDHKIFPHFA